ncbi:MAG: DUF6263 family protein [Planctomycetales bacterium]|nr:DUF6263 family protein [Planctomycetales bacterium]
MTTLRSAVLSVAALAALAALGPAAAAQEPRDLRLAWKPGDVLVYESVGSSTLDMGMMGKATNETRTDEDIAVVSVDEKGQATVRCTVRRFRLKVELGPMGTISCDTDKPDEATGAEQLPFPGIAEGFKVLQQLKGLTFAATVSPRGEVSGVVEVNPFLDKVCEKLGLGAEAADSIKKQYGNERFASVLSSLLRVYPVKPVKVGDLWSLPVNESVGMLGEATGEGTATLKVLEKDRAEVEIATTFTLQKNEGAGGNPMLAQMIEMMKLKEAKQTRTVVLDFARGGVIRKSTASTRIVFEGEDQGMGPMALTYNAKDERSLAEPAPAGAPGKK